MPFFAALLRRAAVLAATLLSLAANAQLVPFPPAPVVKLAVNPVTNKVYSLNEFGNSVTVLDVAAGTSTVIPVGPRPQFIAVNPRTNRIYVNNAGDSTITVIDGATDTNLTPTPLDVGSHGPISVNPVTNVVYIVRLTSPATDEVTFFNGDTHTWYTIATESFQPIAMAVNPVTDTIYVVHYATGDVRIISGTYNDNAHPVTQSLGLWSKPVAVAANPVTNKIYAITEDARGPIFVIDGATRSAVFPLPAAGHAQGPKAIAVNAVTNRIYAAFANEVVVIDGATNAYTYVPVATGSGAVGLAVDPTRNRVYVSNADGVLTVIDGATNATSTVGIPGGANVVGVNPVTGTAFAFGDTLTAVPGSGTAQANPIVASIGALPGNSSGPDATFTISAASSFSPNAPAIDRVYWQLDSRNGKWTAASGNGPWSVTLSGLAAGSHTLHAFATDAQVAPLHSGAQAGLVGTIASYTFTVLSGAASVSLASSLNPSTQGQSVTFTASVAGNSDAPTGTVDFRDGSAAIAGCTARPLAGGVATCTIATLGTGSHAITASYSGDSRYGSAVSSTLSQQVNARATPTVTVASSRNPSTAGDPVTFTANVGGSAGAATGSVDFRDGGSVLPGCGGVALAAGTATCNASALATGTHAITVVYGGNSAYTGGTSGTLSQVVNAAASTPGVALTSSANPSLTGTTVTFTATVSGSAGPASGSVRFLDGSNVIAGCDAVALASGSATCAVGTLAVGDHAITARYSGGGAYLAATSNVLTQQVQNPPPGDHPRLALSASTLAFGAQSMGTTSPAQAVVLTNAGTGTLVINAISMPQQYTQSNNCGALAAGQSCTLSVRFAPAIAPGPLNASSTVTGVIGIDSNSESGAASVQVSGTAQKSLVAHFYRAILDRAPDASGAGFWAAEAQRMASLGVNVNETWFAMAAYFYSSAEYAALARDDTGFVTDLYVTFFNRDPDATGLAFWKEQLAGGMPREVALVSFMFSPEFAQFTQAIFGNTAARAEVDAVLDFYRGVLARLPDDGGFHSYVDHLRDAQCAGSAAVFQEVDVVSRSFLESPEYAQRARTNAQYVGDMYNTFLRRGGEASGVRFWIGQLDSGARTREQVRQSFIASSEFRRRVDAIVAQGCMR